MTRIDANQTEREKLKPESFRHRPVVSDAESVDTVIHRLTNPDLDLDPDLDPDPDPDLAADRAPVVGQAHRLPDSGLAAGE
jgi:hypothetical protein